MKLQRQNKFMTIAQHLSRLGVADVAVIEKEETVSTNADCRRYIDERRPQNPVLVAALSQTGGRGRRGRSFASPPGGLYMSLLVRPETNLSDAVRITTAASVAVCRAVQTACDLRCDVKWVNDIYRRGSKLCGILAEGIHDYEKNVSDYAIVGVGVNLTACPENMNATSILRETGRAPDRALLCAHIVKELLSVLNDVRRGDCSFMEEYRARSCVIGRRVRCVWNGREFQATATGVDDAGGLILRLPDERTEVLTSGEVTLRSAE